MVGTIIIAVVGYAMALGFASAAGHNAWAAGTQRPVISGDLPHSVEFVLNCGAAVAAAAVTRSLTGGQF